MDFFSKLLHFNPGEKKNNLQSAKTGRVSEEKLSYESNKSDLEKSSAKSSQQTLTETSTFSSAVEEICFDSDASQEFESAGENEGVSEKRSDLSVLADNLDSLCISTPNKKPIKKDSVFTFKIVDSLEEENSNASELDDTSDFVKNCISTSTYSSEGIFTDTQIVEEESVGNQSLLLGAGSEIVSENSSLKCAEQLGLVDNKTSLLCTGNLKTSQELLVENKTSLQTLPTKDPVLGNNQTLVNASGKLEVLNAEEPVLDYETSVNSTSNLEILPTEESVTDNNKNAVSVVDKLETITTEESLQNNETTLKVTEQLETLSAKQLGLVDNKTLLLYSGNLKKSQKLLVENKTSLQILPTEDPVLENNQTLVIATGKLEVLTAEEPVLDKTLVNSTSNLEVLPTEELVIENNENTVSVLSRLKTVPTEQPVLDKLTGKLEVLTPEESLLNDKASVNVTGNVKAISTEESVAKNNKSLINISVKLETLSAEESFVGNHETRVNVTGNLQTLVNATCKTEVLTAEDSVLDNKPSTNSTSNLEDLPTEESVIENNENTVSILNKLETVPIEEPVLENNQTLVNAIVKLDVLSAEEPVLYYKTSANSTSNLEVLSTEESVIETNENTVCDLSKLETDDPVLDRPTGKLEVLTPEELLLNDEASVNVTDNLQTLPVLENNQTSVNDTGKPEVLTAGESLLNDKASLDVTGNVEAISTEESVAKNNQSLINVSVELETLSAKESFVGNHETTVNATLSAKKLGLDDNKTSVNVTGNLQSLPIEEPALETNQTSVNAFGKLGILTVKEPVLDNKTSSTSNLEVLPSEESVIENNEITVSVLSILETVPTEEPVLDKPTDKLEVLTPEESLLNDKTSVNVTGNVVAISTEESVTKNNRCLINVSVKLETLSAEESFVGNHETRVNVTGNLQTLPTKEPVIENNQTTVDATCKPEVLTAEDSVLDNKPSTNGTSNLEDLPTEESVIENNQNTINVLSKLETVPTEEPVLEKNQIFVNTIDKLEVLSAEESLLNNKASVNVTGNVDIIPTEESVVKCNQSSINVSVKLETVSVEDSQSIPQNLISDDTASVHTLEPLFTEVGVEERNVLSAEDAVVKNNISINKTETLFTTVEKTVAVNDVNTEILNEIARINEALVKSNAESSEINLNKSASWEKPNTASYVNVSEGLPIVNTCETPLISQEKTEEINIPSEYCHFTGNTEIGSSLVLNECNPECISNSLPVYQKNGTSSQQKQERIIGLNLSDSQYIHKSADYVNSKTSPENSVEDLSVASVSTVPSESISIADFNFDVSSKLLINTNTNNVNHQNKISSLDSVAAVPSLALPSLQGLADYKDKIDADCEKTGGSFTNSGSNNPFKLDNISRESINKIADKNDCVSVVTGVEGKKLSFDDSFTEEASKICELILNSSKEDYNYTNDDHNNIDIETTTSCTADNNSTVNTEKFTMSETVLDKEAVTFNSEQNIVSSANLSNIKQNSFGVKIEDINDDGLMQVSDSANSSEAGPATAEEFHTAESFPLDLDYLAQPGEKLVKKITKLSRQSLYVKFDPLVGEISTEFGVDGEHSDTIQSLINKTLTPMKNTVLEGDNKLISFTPTPGVPNSVAANSTDSPSNLTSDVSSGEGDGEGVSNVTIESNTANLVDQEARTLMKTPREKKQSTSTSSTPQEKDSQITRSGSRTVVSVEVYEKEMQKLQDLMIKQEHLYKEELGSKNTQIEKLAERETKAQAELQKLKKEMHDKSKKGQNLGLVLEEYERTISQMLAQKEQEKNAFEKEKEDIIREKETAATHLSNMELAFNDVHQKYERSKVIIEGMKKNEDELKGTLKNYEDMIRKQDEKYNKLREHAMSQLERANQELENMKKNHESEITKLKAMVKKGEIRVKSLEEALERKTSENAELTQICDELINKVSGSPIEH